MNSKVKKIVNNKQVHFLDTLETTSDKQRVSQYYKAIRKFKTNEKILTLVDATNNQKDKKTYWQTYHCNNVLLQENNVFKGSLCRKRWCTECNRIRTAELVKAYKDELLNLSDLQFVTLTIPNVKKHELRRTIQSMVKAFQLIKDNIKKNHKITLSGVRKIETTHNETTNEYHPHFHFILHNFTHAQLLVELWLKQFRNADALAQNITRIDTTNEKSFIELFKYATKETNANGLRYNGSVLHTIYSAIKGVRIFQPFGNVKKDKTPLVRTAETILTHVEPTLEIWIFRHEKKDWFNAHDNCLINTFELSRKLTLETHNE